jgi:hypothetical protein
MGKIPPPSRLGSRSTRWRGRLCGSARHFSIWARPGPWPLLWPRLPPFHRRSGNESVTLGLASRRRSCTFFPASNCGRSGFQSANCESVSISHSFRHFRRKTEKCCGIRFWVLCFLQRPIWRRKKCFCANLLRPPLSGEGKSFRILKKAPIRPDFPESSGRYAVLPL